MKELDVYLIVMVVVHNRVISIPSCLVQMQDCRLLKVKPAKLMVNKSELKTSSP